MGCVIFSCTTNIILGADISSASQNPTGSSLLFFTKDYSQRCRSAFSKPLDQGVECTVYDHKGVNNLSKFVLYNNEKI